MISLVITLKLKINENNERIKIMTKILFLFMVYAIIGWLWETPYVSLSQKKYINRGFLKGPYIPIYGLSCLTIILSIGIFNTFNSDNLFIILIQILYISLISAIWEYSTSWGLEQLFKTRWWDYSYRKYNLNGRISLDYTILFGIGGYLLWRFINPVFENLYNSLSPNILMIFLTLFYTIFLIDNIYTFRDLFKLRGIIIKLNKLQKEFAGKYDDIFEKAYNSLMAKDKEFKKALADYKNTLASELKKIRTKGGNKLALSIENITNPLNIILSKSKNLSRFYRKYPKTPSKSYLYLLKTLKNKKEKHNK